MIPTAFITDWRTKAPWSSDNQVEQDLVISRALVEIFSQEKLHEALAFRGGTALYKLYITEPVRYSEDIDLVQVKPEKVGPTIDLLRKRLDHWLGIPTRKFNQGSVKLVYKILSEGSPPTDLKLKIEINSREHFSVIGHTDRDFSVKSPWFQGRAKIKTFHLEELLATKLRALYQRKKGRDLLDLWLGLKTFPINLPELVNCFYDYLKTQDLSVTRPEFEANLNSKMADLRFASDIAPILAENFTFDMVVAQKVIEEKVFPLLIG